MPAAVNGGPEINRFHQLFLQSMLLRRAAPKTKWFQVWERCGTIVGVRPDALTEENFEKFIDTCDFHLQKVGFKIAQTIDQGIGGVHEYQGQAQAKWDGSGGAIDKGGNTEPRTEGRKWIALVNFKSDDLAKVATDFNANEIAYFRKLIDAIVQSPNDRFCISNHAARRLGKSVEPAIKYEDCEILLETLVKKGWLSRSEKNFYAFSVRAQLELEYYLKSTYGDDAFLECSICHDLVFRGWHCANPNCHFVAHSMCLKRSLRTQGVECPKCKKLWEEGGQPIGEDAPVGALVALESDSEPEATQGRRKSAAKAKRPSNTKKRTRAGKKKAADSDESEDDEVDSPEEDESPRAARRTSGRSTKGRKSMVEVEAEDDEEDEGEEDGESINDLENALTQIQQQEQDEMEE